MKTSEAMELVAQPLLLFADEPTSGRSLTFMHTALAQSLELCTYITVISSLLFNERSKTRFTCCMNLLIAMVTFL